MNGSGFSGPDPTRTRLRTTLATMEREIARLSRPPSDDRLLRSFADLVAQLALGPEPEVRECPVCQHVGMRAATLCGHCWTKLVPPTGESKEG